MKKGVPQWMVKIIDFDLVENSLELSNELLIPEPGQVVRGKPPKQIKFCTNSTHYFHRQRKPTVVFSWCSTKLCIKYHFPNCTQFIIQFLIRTKVRKIF